MFSVVSVVCCQVSSALGRSLVQRIPTACGVSECDRETSIMRRPWPTGGLLCHGKKVYPVHFIGLYLSKIQYMRPLLRCDSLAP
jgi:hypothetical protein